MDETHSNPDTRKKSPPKTPLDLLETVHWAQERVTHYQALAEAYNEPSPDSDSFPGYPDLSVFQLPEPASFILE